MALEAALTTLAQGFRINLDVSGSAARRFVAQLVPPSSGEKGLEVTDLVTSTQIQDAPVDVLWRTKDVRFVNTDIANTDVTGGMPVGELFPLLNPITGGIAQNAGTVTEGPTAPPGVPGVIGVLTGTIPLPIEVTAPTTFPVTVDVRWRIRDESGGTIADLTWSLGGAPPISGTGGDVAPPLGRAMDALTLVFNLVFTELTSSLSPTLRRSLQASVRLQANGVTTGWIDLPPVDLNVPGIPVPTIAILCQNSNFGSNKLVVVPASSPLDRGTVAAAVNTLRDTLDPLRATFDFLGLFLDSAAQVADLLGAASVTFRKSDQISNLNDIDLESGTFNDTEAEDELSSMILLGPPRRSMECFNARSFDTSEGEMVLSVGIELIAKVASLHNASPTSEPPGRVSVPVTPAGTRWPFWSDITTFGDEFSSLRFSWQP
jgi:hypothetical protein